MTKYRDIHIPNNWRCRPAQDRAWEYLNKGGKRAVLVWHRRLGKDALCLNWGAVAQHTRVGTYWHMLPEATQARKAIWNAVDEFTGIRRIDQAFPIELRKNTTDDEMFIRQSCGSTWQVVGSDNFQSLLGSPPVGCVFSEWAYANPHAWQKISPILAMNGGWAVFISTPNGRNHFSGLYDMAKSEPGWFAEILTVEDTGELAAAHIRMLAAAHTPFKLQGKEIIDVRELKWEDVIALTRDLIEVERRQLAAQRGQQEADSIIAQEYYCSFDAAIPGAYYAKILEEMERDDPSKITAVPHDPGFLVETAWDLGIRDDTAIWFYQRVGREIRIIDYYEAAGPGLDHYAEVLRGTANVEGDNRRRKYQYAQVACVLPHDAGHGQLTQRGGSSLAMVLQKQYGFGNRIVPQTRSLQWSINQVKSFLPTCVFDAKNCKDGLDKLRQYRRKWNDVTRAYADTPAHDFASHASDAFRTLVEGHTNVAADGKVAVGSRRTRMPQVAICDDDPLGR